MDKLSSRDLLSDLPLSMIHCILERVPIRDAVKTSLLSSQWRYKWATLPHLAFDGNCVTPSGDDVIDETRLINFINQALFLHKGPIHKFKLQQSFMENCDHIDQWLIFLSRNDIRMLILDFHSAFHTHSSLYSCQNLTHLELCYSIIPPPPPTFKGFLCLRCLVLQAVDVSSNTIESLVANSPLLEELALHYSRILELKIRAPNLKILYLGGVYSDICLYAPLLVKMQVSGFWNLPKGLQQKTSGCNYTNFLGGFTSLEELIGNPCFMKFLSVGIESCQSSLAFHHLRDIELFDVSFHDMKVTSVVARLITDAPNLHKLEISISIIPPPAPEVPAVSFWDSECAPNFTFERLKVIEMKNVCGRVDEMKFIKFLLANSPVLETMILKPVSYVDAEQLNLAAELLRYRRASSNAEILFRKC